MKKPLLRMLRWLSVAPFGKPVVPLVYWMLIGSSHESRDIRSRSACGETDSPPAISSSQSGVPRWTTRCSAGAWVALISIRAPDLPEHVRELVRAVRRVDVHEDRADLRRRVLRQHPLRAVRRPDRDARFAPIVSSR